MRWHQLKVIIPFILAAHIFFIGFSLLSPTVLPFCTPCLESNFSHPEYTEQSTVSPYLTWDAQNYFIVADHWYAPEQASNAFYPGYPFLLRLFSYITNGNLFWASIILGIILNGTLAAFLYLFVKKQWNEKTAALSVLFLFSFPTAFYLHLPYSESLFLILIISFFNLFIQKKYTWLQTLLLITAILTRPQGIFLIIPITISLVIEYKKEKTAITPFIRDFAPYITSISIAVISYLLIHTISTGSPFSGFLAQQYFISSFSIMNILQPWNWLTTMLLQEQWNWHAVDSSSITNRLFFLFALISLPIVYKKTNLILFTYTVTILALTALLGDFVSYPRYILLLFPIAITFARYFTGISRVYLLSVFILTQLLLLHFHSLNIWIA